MRLNVGKIIKKLRLEKGYSQQYLGMKTGLSQFTIHCIEAGKRKTDLKLLQKITDVLDIELETLLQSEDHTNQDNPLNKEDFITSFEYMGKTIRMIYKNKL